MTSAEKLSALLAAVLIAVCALTGLRSAPQGIAAEKTAGEQAILTGEDGEESDELLPGDTVNINTASLEELCLIPGIGEATAQKILDWRGEHGNFTSIEEFVDEIDGIGENNIENMRMYLALEDDAS